MTLILRAGILLLLPLCVACVRSLPDVAPAPVHTMTLDEVATGTTKDGQRITVTTISIVQEEKDAQGNVGGYRSGNKMRVSRAGSLFGLKSFDTPNAFGCEIEPESYDNFGCYFGSATLVDLDMDGEPEILSEWEQGGSGGYQSLHIYRWDGSNYKLLGVFIGMQLRFEVHDQQQDGRAKVVLRYNVGPYQMAVPWVDVLALSNGALASANKEYPALYRELLAHYEQTFADLEGASDTISVEAREEITRRMETAKAIVGGEGR